MKVAELIRLLKPHAELEVKVTWEGIVRVIERENLYIRPDEVLYIDADDNCYKDEDCVDV